MAVVRERGVESELLRVEAFRRFVAVVAPLSILPRLRFLPETAAARVVIRDAFAWFPGCLVLPGITAYNLGLKRKKRTHVYNEELYTLPRMRRSYYSPPVLLPSVPFTHEPVSNTLFHSISHKTNYIVSNINLFKFHLNVITKLVISTLLLFNKSINYLFRYTFC